MTSGTCYYNKIDLVTSGPCYYNKITSGTCYYNKMNSVPIAHQIYFFYKCCQIKKKQVYIQTTFQIKSILNSTKFSTAVQCNATCACEVIVYLGIITKNGGFG